MTDFQNLIVAEENCCCFCEVQELGTDMVAGVSSWDTEDAEGNWEKVE